MKIHFQNVGQKRASWTSEIEAITYSILLREVRPHLYSRGVDFSFDETGTAGVVVVGSVRIVGHFRIEGGEYLGDLLEGGL